MPVRGGKEHAKQTQPTVSDEYTRASGSTPATVSSGPSGTADIAPENVAGTSNSQSPAEDVQSAFPARAPSESNSGIYQDVLVECNNLVGRYRKGEISKAAVYVDIQSRLTQALGNDRVRTDAAFGSFIATIESHDTENQEASRRGLMGESGAVNSLQRSPSPPVSISDGHQSDAEPPSKKLKVDESVFAWVASRKDKRTVLRESLAKTLKLIEVYTIDPKATKRSLINEPDCPEFPDSEWKNVISGRAINLDAVLSGQLSVIQDETKVEKFGDFEISFGAVEPTKVVKNGGDWTIAWNRAVRATAFAFPHRVHELTCYGEYIVSLFAVTHPSVHSRVIAFDKAVRKRVGSVRNLELSDYERFADLKIAHMDSIGVSVVSGSSKEKGDQKGKRGKNWKKDEPCNKWNEGKCGQSEEDCRRLHVCNNCGKGGHRGKDCRKA
jgi:hypothetical protein